MPPAPVYRHLAYVSHAAEDHAPNGRSWADWVADTLQRYPIPRSLAGRPTPFGPIPARLAPIFKPERNGNEPLPAEAREALSQSRMLIVVCSPAAAQSGAVAEEVRHFKQLGRERIVALIVDGEPDAEEPERECFPDTLKYEVRRDGTIDREWRVHPVVVDARPDRGGARENRLAQAKRLLAAAAMGVPPEALPSEEMDPARSSDSPVRPPARRSSVAAIFAVICLLAAGALGWLAYRANEQRKAAEAARQRSDALILFLQGNLREKLAPLGQLELLAETNERVIEHLERVARETNDPVALSGLANAFRDSAALLEQRGNLPAALEAAVQAAQTRLRVADSPDAPADSGLQSIRDQLLVAQIYLRMGQHREALAVAEQARAAAIALSRKRLGDEETELALAQTQLQVGDAWLELGKNEEAERAFTAAREGARQLAGRRPRDNATQETLASVTERFAKLREQQGDIPGAITELREWQNLLAARAAAEPGDAKADAAVAAAHMRLGNLLMVQRENSQAAAEFRKAAEATERAARAQPENETAQLARVSALHRLGLTLAYDPAAQTEAVAALQRALDHLDEHFPGEAHIQASTARTEIQRLRDSIANKQP